MATVTSLGAGSGLDLEGLVTKLMDAERVPLTELQTKEKSYNSKISALGSLQEQAVGSADSHRRLDPIRNANRALNSLPVFRQLFPTRRLLRSARARCRCRKLFTGGKQAGRRPATRFIITESGQRQCADFFLC